MLIIRVVQYLIKLHKMYIFVKRSLTHLLRKAEGYAQ
jgi:hypothetical protein